MRAASPEDEREDSPSHQEEDGGHEGIGSQQSVGAKGQALNMLLAAIRKSGAGGQVRGDCWPKEDAELAGNSGHDVSALNR